MAYKLTMEEINEYKAAFSLFDEDNDGKIKTEETKKLMRSLGKNLSEKEFTKITKNIDTVEFHEFLEIMAEYRKDEDKSDDLIKAFKYFDHKDKGTINYEEFEHVLCTISKSENLTKEEADKLKIYCGYGNNDKLIYEKNETKKKHNPEFNYTELLNMMLHS